VKCGWQLDAAGDRDVVSINPHFRRCAMTAPLIADIPMTLDNYATHKHKDVSVWLAKPPRFQLHNTATSWSLLSLVERWLRELTAKALRRGVFHALPDLISGIEKYLQVHNNEPRPLVWTATAESVLTEVRRGRVALGQTVSR
jgi:hypothetical protein